MSPRERNGAATRAALIAFGLFEPFVRMAQVARTREQLAIGLDAIKADAQRIYHERALELHPDRGGDAEAMKELNARHDLIKAIEIGEPVPLPVVYQQVTVIVINGGGFAATGTNATTTGGY